MRRSRRPVRTGLDRLVEDAELLRAFRGKRVGLLANPTSVTHDFRHAVDVLTELGLPLARLFGPEHGLRGEAQDMIAVDALTDPLTGIETVSLYGSTLESLTPKPAQLDDLDVMIIDLQDVGARYYTYVYTAMLTTEACTAAGVDVLVLDRPNPIGGAIEGPAIDRGFDSFVGMLPLPNRHGLTLAEVLEFASHCGKRLQFSVLEVEGYHRSMWFDDHDAPWVLPSPNMPTLDTATVYPGMCLLEGTQLSEGRGTTRPFELFGAPYVDAYRLARALEALPLEGVQFRPVSFEPTFQKWARQRCSGLQLHVTDRERFDALGTGAAVVWACAQLFDEFAWRTDAYEFVDTIPAIDLLFGSDKARKAIEAGCTFQHLRELLQPPLATLERLAASRRYPETDA